MLILIPGCIEKKSSDSFDSADSRNYVIYSIKSLPADLYMLNTQDSDQKSLLPLLFDNLVSEDKNGSIIPELAESYTISKDNLIYSFKIKENIFWSDGIAITSQDFSDFLSRISGKDFNNQRKNEFSCIMGMNDYINGKKGFDDVGIETPDAKTLVIKLSTPCSYFLNLLALPEYSLKRVNNQISDSNDSLLSWKTDYMKIPYCGPFRIYNIAKNGEITLIKNNYYMNKNDIKTSKIVIKGNCDNETSLADFDMGKTDSFLNPPVNECSRLLSNYTAQNSGITYTTYLCFNLKNSEAAKNLKFRSAINYAVDRTGLLKNGIDKITGSVNSFINNGNKVFSDNSDISKAKDLIKDANLDNIKINMICLSDSYEKNIIKALVKSLQKELKINIVLNEYDDIQYKDALEKGKFDIAAVEYYASIKMPGFILENWSSENWLNYSGYRSAEYDNNLSRGNTEKDKSKGQQFFNICQNILLKDLPAIPLCRCNLLICASKNISGIEFADQGNLDLRFVYINKSKGAAGFNPAAPSENTY